MCNALDRHEKIDFWEDVYGFNMSAIRALAMGEPLVDCVDQGQVATRPALLATFNLASMTAADAAFSVRARSSGRPTLQCKTPSMATRCSGGATSQPLSAPYKLMCAQVPFKLVATRNDYIHALVVFFDVYFTACHKLVWFSTSPMYALSPCNAAKGHLDAQQQQCSHAQCLYAEELLVAQEPLYTLEADGAVLGGGRGYLRRRKHLRYIAHTSLLSSEQRYVSA